MMRFSAFVFVVAILTACSSLKPTGLYEVTSQTQDEKNINGFYQLNIFKDDFGTEVWYSKEATCLNVNSEKQNVHSGSAAIHIKWNKQAEGGCPWLGLGIGWDGWTGKDLSQITKEAAISFWVKTNEKPYKQLPWAIGFEDFAGNQKWTGVTEDVVVNGPISTNWTQVLIPLDRFQLPTSQVDMYSVKQLMFQFESSGEVFIDQIELVALPSKS